MIKKITLILLFLIISTIASFFIWRYWNYVNDKDPNKTFLFPRLELSELEITSLSSEKTEMLVKVDIKNQLPLSFTIDRLQYRVLINDTEVLKAQQKKSISLKGNASSLITLPIIILRDSLSSVVKANERTNADSVDFHFQGSFFTNIFFKKQFNIDIKRVVPRFHIPEVHAGHFKLDSLNFSRAVVHLVVSITNENAFPFKAENIAYELSIEDNQWIKGTIPGNIEIEEKSLTDLTIPIAISFKEVGKTLWDIITKGNEMDYKLHLTFRIESSNKIIKNSEAILDSEGSVKSLMLGKIINGALKIKPDNMVNR